MVQKKKTKIFALILASVIALLSLPDIPAFLNIPSISTIGITANPHILSRILFHFFHASPVHAVINLWCILSAFFLCGLSIPRFFAAWIIAAAAPSCCLSDIPTLGLSAICFAAWGILTPSVPKKLDFILPAIIYIAIGFFFPQVNALIHLYSFTAGIIFGYSLILLAWIKKNYNPKSSK